MPRLLPTSFGMVRADNIPLRREQSERNRDVCVVPTGTADETFVPSDAYKFKGDAGEIGGDSGKSHRTW